MTQATFFKAVPHFQQNLPVQEARQASDSHELSPLLACSLPLLGSLLIDLADFFSLGPQGLILGLAVGAPCAWWVAKSLGFSQGVRLLLAGCAAIYCAVPFTELVPAATLLTTLSGFARVLQSPAPQAR